MDLATQDEDGFLYFKSRLSSMLKKGGIKVYPAEVEEVLRSFPDVAEVAVVKFDDSLHGEHLKAVIALRNGCQPDPAAIRRFCDGKLHKLKIPRVIEFARELPRTPGGKVAWKKL